MDESSTKADATPVECASPTVAAGGKATHGNGKVSKRGDRALDIIGSQRVTVTEEDVRLSRLIRDIGLPTYHTPPFPSPISQRRASYLSPR